MAQPTELTDSQILDAARQLEQDVKLRALAGVGLREYVRIKQKKESGERELADIEKQIAAKRAALNSLTQANAEREAELAREFAMKKAAKEREFEGLGARLGGEIELLNDKIAELEGSILTMEKQAKDMNRKADADYRAKIETHAKAEKEKIARNKALDEEFKKTQDAFSKWKRDHGL
jgi:predicted  nucleic acid-binding Zn-ribbon protein